MGWTSARHSGSGWMKRTRLGRSTASTACAPNSSRGATTYRPGVQQRLGTFFISPSAATVPSLQATSIWANNSGYEPAAVSTFLQVADYYLVAQALELQYTVVTHEVVANTTRRIKIPNACLGMGVRYVTPFAMLRAEKARFVLPSPPLPKAA